MRSIVVNTVLTRVPTFGSHVRSRLHFASAAVNGSPLCHLTPGRTLNVHCVCPWSFHSVASPGWSLPSGWRETRLSKRLNETRSEEHTSELQSRLHLVCRLLLEKKKQA